MAQTSLSGSTQNINMERGETMVTQRKIRKVLKEIRTNLDNMGQPLTDMELDDIQDDTRIEILEEANKYWGTRNIDYDLDPIEA